MSGLPHVAVESGYMRGVVGMYGYHLLLRGLPGYLADQVKSRLGIMSWGLKVYYLERHQYSSLQRAWSPQVGLKEGCK